MAPIIVDDVTPVLRTQKRTSSSFQPLEEEDLARIKRVKQEQEGVSTET